MIPTCVKICPKCGEKNYAANNPNWLGRCRRCGTIFPVVPITYDEIEGTPPESIRSLEEGIPVVTIENLSDLYGEIARAIHDARVALDQRDYARGVKISTIGREISWKIQAAMPYSSLDRVSLDLVLTGIRVNSLFAIGDKQSWDLALEDIAQSVDVRRLYTNLPVESSKALAVMENIGNVIHQKRHTERYGGWND